MEESTHHCRDAENGRRCSSHRAFVVSQCIASLQRTSSVLCALDESRCVAFKCYFPIYPLKCGWRTKRGRPRLGTEKKLGRGEDDHKRPGKNPNFPKMCEKMPTTEEKKRDTNSTFQLKSLQVKHKVAQRLKSVHKITELKGRQSSWIISAE